MITVLKAFRGMGANNVQITLEFFKLLRPTYRTEWYNTVDGGAEK